ncbi:MAG: glycosyltransferase [Ignavibacteriae bacterium]|nr:MAG: glycosyltransferase [Ignavibacteriota bacterium]
MFISFVIAIYNEQETIRELYRRLKNVIIEQGYNCEIIFINDGSSDNSLNILKDLLRHGEDIIIIEMSNNFGQIAAFSAGFTQAKGDLIVTLDADLQNFPEDVPLLIEKINEGYSLVGGIRKARRDTLRRKIVGNIANYLNFVLTKVKVQDIGCSIKAYRRHIVEGLRSPAGIIKFNAVAAFSLTKDVIEIPVRHANRAFGKSKWNFLSMFQHNLDIWISSHNVIPRLIVAIGTAGFFYGFVMYLLFFTGVFKVSNAMSAGGAILFYAFIILLLGIIAEVCIKILKEFRGTLLYNIKKVWTKDNVC